MPIKHTAVKRLSYQTNDNYLHDKKLNYSDFLSALQAKIRWQ